MLRWPQNVYDLQYVFCRLPRLADWLLAAPGCFHRYAQAKDTLWEGSLRVDHARHQEFPGVLMDG